MDFPSMSLWWIPFPLGHTINECDILLCPVKGHPASEPRRPLGMALLLYRGPIIFEVSASPRVWTVDSFDRPPRPYYFSPPTCHDFAAITKAVRTQKWKRG